MENVLLMDEVDSTNSYIKRNVESLESETVVRTHFQTKGRGQFDRTWVSQKGENLLFSILFKGDIGFTPKQLNQVSSMSILSVLKRYGIEGWFKPPNDVYVADKKLSGILIETNYLSGELRHVILGIGLNVNQRYFGDLPASSMAILLESTLDLEKVFMDLIHELKGNIEEVRVVNAEQS